MRFHLFILSACSEIENVIGLFKGVKESVVYGVDTKVADGKAGYVYNSVLARKAYPCTPPCI